MRMKMNTSFLVMIAILQSLLLLEMPSSCFAQNIFGDLGLSENATNLLITQCLTELTALATCIFPNGFNETNTQQLEFIGRCQQCLESEIGANATDPTQQQQQQQLTCDEVEARLDIGLDACSSTCAVDGCIPAVNTGFQCIFQALVDCTTGETKIPLVAAPTTAPNMETAPAPAPTPARSQAMSLWFSAASLSTTMALIGTGMIMIH